LVIDEIKEQMKRFLDVNENENMERSKIVTKGKKQTA
jgi:hypothetical protein